MGVILPNDVLLDVALTLVESIVNTQVNPSGSVTAGLQTVTPGSMIGIYVGALLVVGANGSVAQEVVTVISTTASTFTVTFVFPHAGTEQVTAATFPSGQTDHPLFTQAEVLGYLSDVQNDFLLKVQPVYTVAPSALKGQIPFYPQPADCIRLERISLKGTELSNVAQGDLDWGDPALQQSSTPVAPTYWFQDALNNQQYGVSPTPRVADTANLMYSQKATTALTLLTPFLVPDVMTFILKYGVLARCWSKDGEQRDPARGSFCQKLYDFWVFVSLKFMQGITSRMDREKETVEPGLSLMRT